MAELIHGCSFVNNENAVIFVYVVYLIYFEDYYGQK